MTLQGRCMSRQRRDGCAGPFSRLVTVATMSAVRAGDRRRPAGSGTTSPTNVFNKLAALRIAGRGRRCSDQAFVRRTFLDTIGTPTPDGAHVWPPISEPTSEHNLSTGYWPWPEFVDYQRRCCWPTCCKTARSRDHDARREGRSLAARMAPRASGSQSPNELVRDLLTVSGKSVGAAWKWATISSTLRAKRRARPTALTWGWRWPRRSCT